MNGGNFPEHVSLKAGHRRKLAVVLRLTSRAIAPREKCRTGVDLLAERSDVSMQGAMTRQKKRLVALEPIELSSRDRRSFRSFFVGCEISLYEDDYQNQARRT